MNNKAFGVFCIALASLLLELALIRVFDVLWYPNMAYLIITLAVFSFGLAGVYLSIRPVALTDKTWIWLSMATLLMAVCTLLIFPVINKLPFDYNQLAGEHTKSTVRNFFLIYIVICAPFFLAGFTLSLVFSHYASQIRRLYFWDLFGAALGSVLLLPLIPHLGTVGTLYVVAGFCLLSSAFFSRKIAWSLVAAITSMIIVVVPFQWNEIKTFAPHMDKRNFRSLQGVSEGTWWDPISKIDVIDYEEVGKVVGQDYTFKWIAYDGGTQTSYFYRFDGDFEKLRAGLPENAKDHFWDRYLAISHYLKADTDAEVLVIGSAGGQETKAALAYNAGHVDGIELVGKVVELGKTTYADYSGNIMNHPRADIRKGEGRSYLRSTDKKYDIIQINSNHTSSSIAAGSGAMQSAYLQTVEAYMEFFNGLNDDGILHINHHIYPKMVATAAQAWANLGRDNFRDHVLVFESSGQHDNLPTFLVKMTPWTEAEVDKVLAFMHVFNFVVNPFEPENSFLTDEFFEADFPRELAATIPYRILPPTDNQPFFNSLRNTIAILPHEKPEVFVNSSVSGLLNQQRSTGIPIDVIHLIVTAGAALVFAFIFTFVPLLFSSAGKAKWEGKGKLLGYFSCLGSGFIIFELVFIQIFMKLIGYPLYTYTTVLFTFLFGAGLGSLLSENFQMLEKRRWWIPFAGIALSTLLLVFSQQYLFDVLLQFGTPIRIFSAIIMIFPLAFFLGMPFPLGILAVQYKPTGTVAWAWAFNGLFTVVGGIFCAIFSVYFGFTATMLVAVVAYMVALALYRGLYAGYLSDQQS
jgi:spermidine synthase